jgi:hypothetical protein
VVGSEKTCVGLHFALGEDSFFGDVLFVVTNGDILAIHKLYPLAQRLMKAGLYMPNRLSMACSRRNCCYWRQCEKELGGEVPET